MSILEENKVLKNLIFGKWVDCELVCKALNIDFSTGLKMFDFGRTAEWCKAPLNGQKITTKFKLKNSKDADFDEELEDFETVNESGWIPVENRLPENEVLCCDECGNMLVGYIFKDEYSNTGYNAESDNESITNAVAWMPLPTPYKKEKSYDRQFNLLRS